MKNILIIIYLNILLANPIVRINFLSSLDSGTIETSQTILIDNDYNIINEWNHDTGVSTMAYLSSDSILYVPSKIAPSAEGGRFKKMTWNGEIIWDYYLPQDICIPHHDITVLPNGNIITICSEEKTQEEGINAGILDLDGPMTLDMVVEIEPIGTDSANIVWKWHFWDHLIQDTDPNLPNFGVIANNPGRLDINCEVPETEGLGIKDWNHCNSISYNPILNQIVLSSRFMNELFVIDHSTTTQEAESSLGGNSNKGGDFLYRWGNPQNYDRGDASTKILRAQHCVNWIPLGYPGEGNLIMFNNRHSSNNSSVLEIIPPLNEDGTYVIDNQNAFAPESYNWIYQDNFFSGSQSGAFRLPNGNTIITSTTEQHIFEINSSNEVVWEYYTDFNVAKAIKYSYDYFESSLSGDFNDDNLINILDVITLVNTVLSGNSTNTSYDLNNDDNINILDIIYLINLILVD